MGTHTRTECEPISRGERRDSSLSKGFTRRIWPALIRTVFGFLGKRRAHEINARRSIEIVHPRTPKSWVSNKLCQISQSTGALDALLDLPCVEISFLSLRRVCRVCRASERRALSQGVCAPKGTSRLLLRDTRGARTIDHLAIAALHLVVQRSARHNIYFAHHRTNVLTELGLSSLGGGISSRSESRGLPATQIRRRIRAGAPLPGRLLPRPSSPGPGARVRGLHLQSRRGRDAKLSVSSWRPNTLRLFRTPCSGACCNRPLINLVSTLIATRVPHE